MPCFCCPQKARETSHNFTFEVSRWGKKHFKGPCWCIRYLRMFRVLQTILVSPKYHIEEKQPPPTLHCTLRTFTSNKVTNITFVFLAIEMPLSPQQEHISPTFGGPGNLRLGFCMHIHHPTFYVSAAKQLLRYTLSFANNPTFHGSYCSLLDIVLERNILT